ncbi:hypothetical protein IQ07DRAFT_583515 [Pyrenochaeta sp. DS3sAY3a]|nr:hypothetical protein IQ07DRAFT_583515 [Pyrenochaeta sp. DS3sAY3a]
MELEYQGKAAVSRMECLEQHHLLWCLSYLTAKLSRTASCITRVYLSPLATRISKILVGKVRTLPSGS